MSLMIIDYGMGNLSSVQRAMEEVGAACYISDNPADIQDSSALLLPGVGAFAEGMRNLNSSGMSEAIKSAVTESDIPLLGICLGMQLLATSGEEGPLTPGLDLIHGSVRKISPQLNERLPHIGWNEVNPSSDHPMLEGISPGSDFYFVHSYHFDISSDVAVARTPFAGGITSVVARDTIWGVQFHPEKSSKPGLKLLKNFTSTYT